MNRLAYLSLLIALFAIAPTAQTQPPPPLTGPLLAVTPARQDHIRLHDIATGATRTLSFGYGEHHVWGFSPDGCRLLFTRDDSGIGLPLLYTADLNGGDVRAMVRYDERAPLTWGTWEPHWSAQNQIAFTFITEDVARDGAILRSHFIAVINGSAPDEPIIYTERGREFTPQWSPDGAWLAYVSYDGRVPGPDISATAPPTLTPPPGESSPALPIILEADLFVIDADGETGYALTDFPVGNVRAPRWSPDGDLIGFVYSPSPNNDTFWMIANNPNALTTQLSFNSNVTLDHTWRPDGTAMVAAVRNFRDTAENRLWQIPLIGNADESASLFIADNAIIHADYPRFSADGRYIAFRNEYALIVYDLQVGVWSRLDELAPGNTPPVWSPAGFAGEEACE